MTYRESLDWLYGLQVHGIKLGLENMSRLCAALGIETRSSPGRLFIHVAGTNGKGSVCAMIAGICSAMGRRTGLYTSPHLVSFGERIRMGRNCIPETDVEAGIARIRSAIEGWDHSPTFFEVTTALAMYWFQQEQAEIVVLETGMGGRLDATNVVTPVVSVLTAIGLDHTQHLGGTLAEIAAEKAGIIKQGVPVISAPQLPDAERVISEVAARLGARLKFIPKPLSAGWSLALAGSHQRWNAAVAFAAVIEAGLRPVPQVVGDALAAVHWPGRFQKVNDRLVLDGAHNPSAAAQLAETWQAEFGDDKATLVLGMLADKDATGVVDALAPITDRVICIPVRSPRGLPAADLVRVIREKAPSIPVVEAASLAAALPDAERGNGRILVTGSLFLVGEALIHFGLAEGSQERSTQ